MRALLKELLRGIGPDFAAFVEALGDALPLLGELAGTPQEREWHGEGDVATHTKSSWASKAASS